MGTKKNLLITLADGNFVQQAKQLFSSVYWNAGWDGDYMLFSHEIPEQELDWFRKKGILIKKCEPLHNVELGRNYSPIVLDKFYLFSPELKAWKNIIFLDSDMIVKASLEKLTHMKRFGAVATDIKLGEQYTDEADPELFGEVQSSFDLYRNCFNAGIFAFPTDIVTDTTIDELIAWFNKYRGVVNYPEEGILNLYFCGKWSRIPSAYNQYTSVLMVKRIRYEKIPAIVLHFIRIVDLDGYKPWERANPFYDEWTANLEKAEQMDLQVVQPAAKWSDLKICYYSWRYNRLVMNPRPRITFRYIINTPDRMIGKIGIFIKRRNPEMYYKLKKHWW